MNTSFWTSLSPYLLLIALLPTIHAITLSQFQPIDGFSQACINAYNTPLSGCTASDLQQGACSTACIAFLEALTEMINSECDGTGAYPNTLIGLFFKNEGTSALCPNVLGGSADSSSEATMGVGQASTYTLEAPTSTMTPLGFTTATLPLLNAALTTSSSYTLSTTSSSSSASAAATTTQVAIVNTTVAPATSTSTASPTVSASSTSHPHSQGSSASTTSTPTATSGGDNNGGGSPLDVGSTSASIHITGMGAWAIGLILVSSGLNLAS